MKRSKARLGYIVTYDPSGGPKRGWTVHVRATDRVEASREARRLIGPGMTIRAIRREPVRR